MEKLKVSLIQLGGCSGCVTSIFLSPVFPDFLKVANLRYSPLITDFYSIVEPLDVAFVEGSVSEDAEKNFLMEVRSKTEKLIAVGTCACFGGIMSLSENIHVHSVADFVEIDYYVPGCPPSEKQVGDLLSSLMTGEEFKLVEKNLCSECEFKLSKTEYPVVVEKLFPDRIPEKCLLEEKVLCLGPIIRAGCEAICVRSGFSCEGCNGPCKTSFSAALIDFLSLLEVSPKLEAYLKDYFFRFQKYRLK